MANLTPLRYEGNVCSICGTTTKFKSNYGCVQCNKNRSKTTGASKKSKEKTKFEVLKHYGGKCECCGETGQIFLNIDHIEDNGAQHRKEQPEATGGARFYYWLKKNKFPDGYRVLCFNCNFATHWLGECPHKTNK